MAIVLVVSKPEVYFPITVMEKKEKVLVKNGNNKRQKEKGGEDDNCGVLLAVEAREKFEEDN